MSKKKFILVFFLGSIILSLLAIFTGIRPKSAWGTSEFYYIFLVFIWILVFISVNKNWLNKKQFFIVSYVSSLFAYIGMDIYYIISTHSYPIYDLAFVVLFLGGAFLWSGAFWIIPIMYIVYFILSKLKIV